MQYLAILIFSLLILMYIYIKYIVERILNTLNIKLNRIIIYIITLIITLLGINIFNISSIFILYLLLVSIILDVVYLLLKSKIKSKKIIKIYNLTLLPTLITIIIFIYGFINMRTIVKTEYTINTNKLNEDLKVLYISDLHFGNVLNAKRLEETIKQINKDNYDLVFLGGDIVDENTSKEEMKSVFKILGKINNKDGIYYIYGNHDKQNYSKNKTFSTKELIEAINNNNINIIEDDYKEINESLVIIGRNDFSLLRKEINEIWEKNTEKFVITLDHQPIGYKENNDLGVDLIISGHTHAGQIFPLGIFIDIFKTSEMSYGYKKEGTLNAIVSSGFSGWGYPIRTQKHSEYVVINIK